MSRFIAHDTIQILQQEYERVGSDYRYKSSTTLPTYYDDDNDEEKEDKKEARLRFRQEMALRVRKYMVSHLGDGLPSLNDQDSKFKTLIRALVENLPHINPYTPRELLDGLTKCNGFVIIAMYEDSTDNGFQDALPVLANPKGEVFLVAGQSEDERFFVAKSQNFLLEAGSSEWDASKMGKVDMEDCSVALLDMKCGGWVVCKADV